LVVGVMFKKATPRILVLLVRLKEVRIDSKAHEGSGLVRGPTRHARN